MVLHYFQGYFLHNIFNVFTTSFFFTDATLTTTEVGCEDHSTKDNIVLFYLLNEFLLNKLLKEFNCKKKFICQQKFVSLELIHTCLYLTKEKNQRALETRS